MAFDYSTLITDRTAEDVAYVKELIAKGWSGMSTDERTEFLAGLKGAYNYTDLNRVVAAMQDIVERVSDLGDTIDYTEVNSGEDFVVCQIELDTLEDYLADVKAIQEYFGLADYELPDDMLSLNYTYANNIETILWLGALITEIGTAAVLTDEESVVLQDEDSVILVDSAGDEEPVDYEVGDQITYEWKSITSSASTLYEAANNVVSLEDVTLKDGSTVSALTQQWVYTTPTTVPFDAPEAIYYASSALPAGTYYFYSGANSSSYGLYTTYAYEFTLKQSLPVGGQFCASDDISSSNPFTSAAFTTYWSKGSTYAIETGVISSCLKTEFDSTGKTYLGTFTNAINGNFNDYRCVVNGNGRWSQSAARQWLNSDEGIGFWWEAQNDWDRPPSQLYTMAGFLAGYGSGVKNKLLTVKVETVVAGTSESEIDVTYDKVFLPSLEQINVTPYYSEGLEGTAWQYWIDETGSETYITPSSSTIFPVPYNISTHTAQYVATRTSQTISNYRRVYSTSTGNYSAKNTTNYCPAFCIAN